MRIRTVLLLTLAALVLSACQPTPGPTPDMPAALTQAAATLGAALTQTAEAPAPISGIAFEADGVRFIIPQAVASGATVTRIPAVTGADLPFFATNPNYRQVTLVNYALSDQFHDPTIYIFPVQEYISINEAAGREISDLQSVFANPGAIADLRNLPFLPTFNAGQVFHAQTRLIDFMNGKGLRFLTLFSQWYTPINNNELVYTFQGLTSDGAYYVSVLLPTHHAILPYDGDPTRPAPPGGYAVPDINASDFEQNYNTYLRNVTQALNDMDPSSFSPTLVLLDGLVRSIEVFGP